MKIKMKELKGLVKESWDDIYDDPYEAELANIAHSDPTPAMADQEDAAVESMAQEIMADIQSLIDVTKEDLLAQGHTEEEAAALAKKEAAETLEIYQMMFKERYMRSDELLLLED
jgi:uncharacterized protein YjbJ (UPF0337 family)